MANDVTKIQRGYAARPDVSNEQKAAKVREVAEMYEKHFLREMVKAMRSTVGEGGMLPTNQAEKIFSEQLDEKYVDNWSQRGGVGLADLIQDQLMQRFGEQMGLRFPTAKPKGPIALDGKSLQEMKDARASLALRTQSSAKDRRLDFSIHDSSEVSREVAPPWSGTLTEIQNTPGGDKILGVDHGQGFHSLLKFRGELLTHLQPGPVQAGQPLANWDSGQGDMTWTLKYQPDSRAE